MTQHPQNDMIKKEYLERPGANMNNLILFLNSFFSYLLVVVIVAALGGVAIYIGIRMRKNKNRQLENGEKAADA